VTLKRQGNGFTDRPQTCADLHRDRCDDGSVADAFEPPDPGTAAGVFVDAGQGDRWADRVTVFGADAQREGS